MRAYEEIVDFIAAGPSMEAVAVFRPSTPMRRRVATLVRMEKAGELSTGERSELDHCLALEHLMRLARARAGHLLTTGENHEPLSS